MDYSSLAYIATKSFVAIITLFILAKALGKKQVSQLNIFDYIIGISIGNIAAEMSVNEEIDYLEGIISMFIYAGFSLFVSFLTMKSIKVRRLIAGAPIILMQDGQILTKGLKKVKFDINDLLQEARANGYFDISEIEYAVMEADGRISFLPKSKYAPVTLKDMKIKDTYKGLTANLVIDGNIMEKNLKIIGKDKKWLMTKIENNHKKLEDILLLTCDSKETITIYDKNIDIPVNDCLE